MGEEGPARGRSVKGLFIINAIFTSGAYWPTSHSTGNTTRGLPAKKEKQWLIPEEAVL